MWILMWLFSMLDSENVWSHSLQECGFSPVWIFMCCFRLPDWETILSHSLHTCGLSPVWILMCPFRWSDWENVLPHSLQECCFSPVWILMWLFRLLDSENCWSHSLQICGFSPVWFLSCVCFRLFRLRNMFCHIHCRNVVSPLCESLCVPLDYQIEQMSGHIPCRNIVSPQHGLSLCVSLDCQIQKMCCNIPYSNVVYLLCESSYVSSGWYTVRTFGHIPCMAVVSPQCAWCDFSALTKRQIYSYTDHTEAQTYPVLPTVNWVPPWQ